ncbi:MAG: laminin G domain-containing protein, partial [bacterium]|nr:laminin G domain-containing protein [Candidatus Colisoma equi]
MIKRLMMFVVASLTAGLSFANLPDPIAWWTMDEFVKPGLAKDVTGNGYDFQAVGSDVRFEEGPFGHRAIRFGDTKMAWAQVKAPNLQKATERKYTVSMWLRLEKNGGQLGGSVNAYPYLYNNLNGDRAHVTYENADSAQCYVASTSFAARHGTREQWNFVTLVVDAVKDGETWTTRVVSYVNGASKADNTKTLEGMGGFTSAFMLGNNGLNDTGSRPINAAIADFRIYDSALTAAQVSELYVDSAHPRTPRLVAYWPMDEIKTSGGVRTTPVVGSGFSDMTLGTEVTAAPGVHGQAVKYGMSKASYGETRCLMPAGLGSWSFAAWVKNPYVTTNANVRLYEWYDSNRMQLNTADNNFKIYCNVGNGCTTQKGSATGIVQREGWSHFAVSYDFGAGAENGEYACNVSFFVNGKKVESLPAELEPAGNVLTSFIAPSNSLFQLGGMKSAGNPNSCNGMFDDVCIFSGALDEDAAAELYNGAKPVDAGVDFAVAADRAVLRGEVVYDLSGLVGYPEATNVKWELVSAPAGGESAAIQNPGSPVTEVTLPVEGAYVFKLVSPHRFLPQTDTVQVTRRAKKTSNTPPTLTVTAPATASIETPVTLGVT